MPDSRRLGQVAAPGVDPLDRHIQQHGGAAAIPWSRVSSQTTLLLLAGLVLGPHGLAVLTPDVMGILRPAVPVALAVLGVSALVGLPTATSTPRAGLPVILGMAVLVSLGVALSPADAMASLRTAVSAAALGVMLAGAGWLVAAPHVDEEERRVFSIATLLLLGGVADYLGVSAVLIGWVAASAWRLVKPGILASIRLDAAYVQHPVTALLLVTAGALVQFTWPIVILATTAVAVHTAVALLRPRPLLDLTPATNAVSLSPGVIGIALAMDAAHLDPRLLPLLSVAVLAVLCIDAFAIRRTGGIA